jgi:GNAT superfamily N-acetyltransferase
MLDFRQALTSDAALLSQIALASKSYWPYSLAQLALWASTLRVSETEIDRWPTITAHLGEVVIGFYQLTFQKANPPRLEHFWLLPEYMGKGFGRRMFNDATRRVEALGAGSFTIEADPHAEAFYLACGAIRIGETPAPIEGAEHRVLPVLERVSSGRRLHERW